MGQTHEIQAAVDRALCIGNGVCTVLAPQAFELDDSHKAIVLNPAVESEDALLAAARACPVQAIYLSHRDRPIYP